MDRCADRGASRPHSQDSFVESYLTHQRSNVFSSVAVLIFVFDVRSREPAADLVSFSSTVRALHEHSPASKIFVLLHKMDLVGSAAERATLLAATTADVGTACAREGIARARLTVGATSIWDQSLYRAWTQVVHELVPHVGALETALRRLADVLDARELVLYERATCLAVTQVTRGDEADNPFADRCERISSILKTHKHAMAKHSGRATAAGERGSAAAPFAEMQIKTPAFMFFIARLTEYTNLAVVLPAHEGAFNAARLNVQLARPEFASLDIVDKVRGGGDGHGADDSRDPITKSRNVATGVN